MSDHTPGAVLWDLDGTLVDTEPYWIEAEFDLAERQGAVWSHDHALNLVGRDLLDSARYVRDAMALDLAPEQIRDDLLDGVISRVRREVPWMPGARELLAELNRAAIPTALVTMSYRRLAEPIVAALPPGSFSALVVGDEVSHGKPHPAPYLRAAQLLGVSPSDAVAIEDSPTGAASAEAAGCTVVVVPNHVPVPTSPQRRFRASLEGLTLAELEQLTADVASDRGGTR